MSEEIVLLVSSALDADTAEENPPAVMSMAVPITATLVRTVAFFMSSLLEVLGVEVFRPCCVVADYPSLWGDVTVVSLGTFLWKIKPVKYSD